MTTTPGDTTPAEAITAACNAAEIWTRHTLIAPRELGYRQGMVLAGLTAAAPLIAARAAAAQREADIRERVAEQHAVHEDLALLLRVLGLGDHARPQSPHEVMLEAISEAGRLRARLAELLAAAAEEER